MQMRFKDQFGNTIKPDAKSVEQALLGFSGKIIEQETGIFIENVGVEGFLVGGDVTIPDTFTRWETEKLDSAVDFFWSCCASKLNEKL